MEYPNEINGKKIISISKKGQYGKFGNTEISYIAIVFDNYVQGYISYDLDNEYNVLGYLYWDDGKFEDCQNGIQITYSTEIEWEMT